MYKNINVSIAKHLPKSNCMWTEVEIFESLVISSDSTDPGEKKKCYMNKIRCIVLEFLFDMYKNINVSIAKHLPKSNCMWTEVEIFESLVISSDSTDPGEKKKCYMNKIRCIVLEFLFDMYKNINVSIAKHLPKSNCMWTEVEIFESLVISSDSTDPGEKKKCYMNKIRCIVLEFLFDMYKNINVSIAKHLPKSNCMSTLVEIFGSLVISSDSTDPGEKKKCYMNKIR